MNAVASCGLNEQITFLMCHKEKDDFKVLPSLPHLSQAAHKLLMSSAQKQRKMNPTLQRETECPLKNTNQTNKQNHNKTKPGRNEAYCCFQQTAGVVQL